MWNWTSSSSQENDAIREKYNSFVQHHGELFEDKIEPLSEEDIGVLSKRKRNISTIWYVAMVIAVVICLVFVAFAPIVKVSDAFYMTLFVSMIGLAGWMFLRQLRNALRSNEKRIVKGVITSKMMLNKDRKQRGGCYFE